MTSCNPQMRLRNWVFTLNNYTDEDIEHLKSLAPEHTKYMVFGKEVGEDEKTPHLQGYLELKSSTTFLSMKRIFGDRFYFDRRRGTRQQASSYCKKQDANFFEFGSCQGQGRRTDCERFMELIHEKRTFLSMCEELPQALRFPQAFKTLRQEIDQLEAPQFRDNMVVEVFYGRTRTGKTRDAVLQNPGAFILDKANSIWFDGYDRNQCLIIDDFDGWLPFRVLLRILDGNKFRSEIKRGFTWAFWTKVVITSNVHPDLWYPGQDDIEPLTARFTAVRHYPLE